MTLNKLRDACYTQAAEKGWHDRQEDDFPTKIALIHSEVSEALEEYRKNHGTNEIYVKAATNINERYGEDQAWVARGPKDKKPEGIPIELADILIRVLDLCGQYRIDIQEAYDIKMAYNQTREYRHGNKKV